MVERVRLRNGRTAAKKTEISAKNCFHHRHQSSFTVASLSCTFNVSSYFLPNGARDVDNVDVDQRSKKNYYSKHRGISNEERRNCEHEKQVRVLVTLWNIEPTETPAVVSGEIFNSSTFMLCSWHCSLFCFACTLLVCFVTQNTRTFESLDDVEVSLYALEKGGEGELKTKKK